MIHCLGLQYMLRSMNCEIKVINFWGTGLSTGFQLYWWCLFPELGSECTGVHCNVHFSLLLNIASYNFKYVFKNKKKIVWKDNNQSDKWLTYVGKVELGRVHFHYLYLFPYILGNCVIEITIELL